MTGSTAPPVSPVVSPGPSLRDIHLPAEPSWWPPAPGWWLLAVLVLGLLAFVAWAWHRNRHAYARRQHVLDELDRLVARQRQDGSPAFLRDLHQLLRRVAREHDAHATLQRGEAWRRTLARVPVDAATLDRLLALDRLIYLPPGECDDEAIVAAVRNWLRLAVKPSNWASVTSVGEASNA